MLQNKGGDASHSRFSEKNKLHKPLSISLHISLVILLFQSQQKNQNVHSHPPTSFLKVGLHLIQVEMEIRGA